MKINKGSVYEIVKGLTPPIILSALKKTGLYSSAQKLANEYLSKDQYKPEWCKINAGLLKGKNIFLAPNGVWKDMVAGEYDKPFWNYLKKKDLLGKCVFDIGAHIGYSALSFAELVGPTGKVYAFEPNIFNKERFQKILDKNNEYVERVSIYDVAVSDKKGEIDFVFNDNIDGGQSSGSFIEESHTFFVKESYEKDLGFKRVKTKTIPMDNFSEIGIDKKPDLIKLDIEGAEFLALEGAKKLLAEKKPILLIEIHSIFNMLKVGEMLRNLNYKIELLNEEKDGRCFISAE